LWGNVSVVVIDVVVGIIIIISSSISNI